MRERERERESFASSETDSKVFKNSPNKVWRKYAGWPTIHGAVKEGRRIQRRGAGSERGEREVRKLRARKPGLCAVVINTIFMNQSTRAKIEKHRVNRHVARVFSLSLSLSFALRTKTRSTMRRTTEEKIPETR